VKAERVERDLIQESVGRQFPGHLEDVLGHAYQRRRWTPLYLSNASGSGCMGGSSACPTPGWLGAGGLPYSRAEHVQQDWPRYRPGQTSPRYPQP
jgi:hypothetical protein